MKSNFLAKIERMHFYLDYLKEHYENVQKAWKEIQEKCIDMDIVSLTAYRNAIDEEVKIHDMSKLSEDEFVQYQEKHYPADFEKSKEGIRVKYMLAYTHHKVYNFHHYSYHYKTNKIKSTWKIHCVHMIIDWMAMGYRFGDTAYDFYQNAGKHMKLPSDAVVLIDQMFQRLYGKTLLTDEF